MKYISLLLGSLLIISCATRESASFKISKEVSTDDVFSCTVSSIHFFNSPDSKALRSANRQQYPIFNRFKENITQQQIASGRLILGDYNSEPSLFSYQLKVIRKQDVVRLYGKTVGPYYNKEVNLEPSLNILSQLILKCIDK